MESDTEPVAIVNAWCMVMRVQKEQEVTFASQYATTSHCQHWDLYYMHFCDKVHMHICDFTMDYEENIHQILYHTQEISKRNP